MSLLQLKSHRMVFEKGRPSSLIFFEPKAAKYLFKSTVRHDMSERCTAVCFYITGCHASQAKI